MSIEKQPLPLSFAHNWLRHGNSETFESTRRMSVTGNFDPNIFFGKVFDLNKQGISVRAIVY